MSEKKPTIASLKREIERLESRLSVAEDTISRQLEVYRNNLYKSADAEMKIKQAIAILTGVDE